MIGRGWDVNTKVVLAQTGIRKEPIGRPSLILNFEVKKIKMKKHLRRKGDTHAD
jgi:hypothetical protein